MTRLFICALSLFFSYNVIFASNQVLVRVGKKAITNGGTLYLGKFRPYAIQEPYFISIDDKDASLTKSPSIEIMGPHAFMFDVKEQFPLNLVDKDQGSKIADYILSHNYLRRYRIYFDFCSAGRKKAVLKINTSHGPYVIYLEADAIKTSKYTNNDSVSTFEYDEKDNLVLVKSMNSKVKRSFNELGQLVNITETDNRTDKVLWTSDFQYYPNGSVRYERASGYYLSKTGFEVEIRMYDENKNLIRQTIYKKQKQENIDGKRTEINYIYDDNKNLIAVSRYDYELKETPTFPMGGQVNLVPLNKQRMFYDISYSGNEVGIHYNSIRNVYSIGSDNPGVIYHNKCIKIADGECVSSFRYRVTYFNVNTLELYKEETIPENAVPGKMNIDSFLFTDDGRVNYTNNLNFTNNVQFEGQEHFILYSPQGCVLTRGLRRQGRILSHSMYSYSNDCVLDSVEDFNESGKALNKVIYE